MTCTLFKCTQWTQFFSSFLLLLMFCFCFLIFTLDCLLCFCFCVLLDAFNFVLHRMLPYLFIINQCFTLLGSISNDVKCSSADVKRLWKKFKDSLIITFTGSVAVAIFKSNWYIVIQPAPYIPCLHKFNYPKPKLVQVPCTCPTNPDNSTLKIKSTVFVHHPCSLLLFIPHVF